MIHILPHIRLKTKEICESILEICEAKLTIHERSLFDFEEHHIKVQTMSFALDFAQ